MYKRTRLNQFKKKKHTLLNLLPEMKPTLHVTANMGAISQPSGVQHLGHFQNYVTPFVIWVSSSQGNGELNP